MSRILPESFRGYLRRLDEFPTLFPRVLENKGSDDDILTVYVILNVFKPEKFIKNDLLIAKIINVLVSRGLYREAREMLRDLGAKRVAKAMILKALTSYKPEELKDIINALDAVDLEAVRNVLAPEVIRGTADKELLSLADKLVTPKTLEERLRVVRESFYGTSDEDAINLLIKRIKRFRKDAHKVLDALIDVRPDPDWEYVNRQLGEQDYRRLVLTGGRSKKVLKKIEHAIIEGLQLGRIGQFLHDYPELKPVGEYILENYLRRKIPEDERRGMFLRALHFFPTLKGYGPKLLTILSDAIKYAIENEDVHLLRIAVSQLADIDVHPSLKAKVLHDAIVDIKESDRFFDALDVIMRHLTYDNVLAAEIVKVVAEVLPDIRAIIAVFGDALRRLLSSPAAYEVLEALIEAKPGDKALPELLNMVTDERARIRAAIKMSGKAEGYDPYKVLLYAYDLLSDEELLKLLKESKVDVRIIPAIKRAIEIASKSDLEWISEKIKALPVSNAADLYVALAAKTGNDKILEPLLSEDKISIDYESAETLAILSRNFPTAEKVLLRFIDLDPIISAIVSVYRGDKKVLRFAEELSKRNPEAAISMIASAFEGTNDLDAAQMVMKLSGGKALKELVRIAPDAIYVEPLYSNIRKMLEQFI